MANRILFYIIATGVILLAFVLLFRGVEMGVEKAETQECQKWIAQSKEYALWQWADWQKAQCEHYGYEIN